MLVIKVELWPFGNHTKAKEIARTAIANVGRDSKGYSYRIVHHEKENLRGEEVLMGSLITGHDRQKPLVDLLWDSYGSIYALDDNDDKLEHSLSAAIAERMYQDG